MMKMLKLYRCISKYERCAGKQHFHFIRSTFTSNPIPVRSGNLSSISFWRSNCNEGAVASSAQCMAPVDSAWAELIKVDLDSLDYVARAAAIFSSAYQPSGFTKHSKPLCSQACPC